jgi:hypothetical protein
MMITSRALSGMVLIRVAMLGVAALAAVSTLTGCAAAAGTSEKKVAYLQADATHGAQTHARLLLQGAQPTRQRCAAATYDAVQNTDTPTGLDGTSTSRQWRREVTTVFVDSCVSGKPSAPAPDKPAPAPAPCTVPPVPPAAS